MKRNRLICIMLTLLLVLTAMFAVACTPENLPPVAEGPETGTYYVEVDDDTYELTLKDGNAFIFKAGAIELNGYYTADGNKLALEDKLLGMQLTANVADNALELNYNGKTYSMLKKVNFTVKFDTDGGDAVADQNVLNGKTATAPTATKENFYFVGWFADANFEEKFDFNMAITADTLVYAYFVEKVDGDEFVINFAEADMEPMETLGGMLFDVADPAEKDGFTFGGWWISMYNDADKLSYPLEADTMFKQDMTLYPLWIDNADLGNKLATPMAKYADGMLTWDGMIGVSEFAITVNGPEGFEAVDATTGGTSYAVDLADAPEGDYVFTLTAKGSVEENDSEPAELYYLNNGLAQVSHFAVTDFSILQFNKVENATNYLLTIDCGIDAHEHTDLDLGDNNTYDFAACEMQVGGIVFTVKAVADGFVTSTATYTFDRTLADVANVEAKNDVLTWDAVEGATKYIVTVDDGELTTMEFTDALTCDLKYFNPAEDGVVITVTAAAKGYNNSTAADYTYNKTTLATPDDVYIESTNVVWTAVEGADSYMIKINGDLYTSNTNSLSWPTALIDTADMFDVEVKAVGATDSLWGAFEVAIATLPTGLAYNNGMLTWNGVIGADSYEYKTAEGAAETTTKNFGEVTLYTAGDNTLYVRSLNDGEYSEWAEMKVKAYEVTLEADNGDDADALYLAAGDAFAPNETTKYGYTFGGWYVAPQADGASDKFNDEFFNGNADVTLYAHWMANTLTITENYDDDSNYVAVKDVTFGEDFELDYPGANLKNGKSFVGWYTFPNGEGVRYTNENAFSILKWDIDNDIKLYAYWADVLEYDKLARVNGDDIYSVVKGPQIALVNEVTIPGYVNGLRVEIVDGYAFKESYNSHKLHKVNLPDTIEILESTAFNYCYDLAEVNVYEVEGNKDVYYTSFDGVLYRYDDFTDELELSYFPEGKAGEYTIPEFYTEVPEKMLYNRDKITVVTIPKEIVAIGARAFYGCGGLEQVIFEGGSTDELTVGEYAFANCTSLTEITLPARLAVPELNVIEGCDALQNIFVENGHAALKDVDGVLYDLSGSYLLRYPQAKAGEFAFPTGVVAINEYAFEECTGVQEIYIPNGLAMGDNAFRDCDGLLKVTFGAGENEMIIATRAFMNCDNLEEIIFEEGSNVTVIEDYGFWSCDSLTEITIPGTVTMIETKAFGYCDLIESVTFAEGSELSFGSSVFYECDALTSIYLPASVSELSLSAFEGCDALSGVYVAENNPYFVSEDGVLFTKDKTEILFYAQGRKGEYVLPTTVEIIGDYVFANNNSITEIFISKNVEYVGEEAFAGCGSLKTVTFEEGGDADLVFGDYVFSECKMLKEAILPERLVDMGTYTFEECTSLYNVKLPSGTELIPEYAFYNCDALKTVDIPKGVTTIGDHAFSNCSLLETIALPDGLVTIGGFAFSSCERLESIFIPNTVEAIAISTFSVCYGLTNVEFEKGGTAPLTIGWSTSRSGFNVSAFYACKSLVEIEIPARTVALGANTFLDCAKLESVIFRGESNVEYIESGTFNNCKMLTAVELPAKLKFIDEKLFYGCSGITTITLPATLTDTIMPELDEENHEPGIDGGFYPAIGKLAFAGCSSLTEVKWAAREGDNALLPVSMADQVFSNCSALAEFTVPAFLVNYKDADGNTIEALGEGLFSGCDSLAAINVDADNASYASDEGVLYNKKMTMLMLCPENKTGDYEIPATATRVYAKAFENSNLTNVTMEEGEETLRFDDDFIFYYSNIKNIVLNNRVEKLVEKMFYHSNGLVSVTLPDAITVIPESAFYGCSALTTVNLGENIALETIADDAFYNCDSLTTFVVPATVTEIGDDAFNGCDMLATVTFEGADDNTCLLESIGDGAFEATALTEVTIPATVKIFGDDVFADCEMLKSVTIPAAVDDLEISVFDGAINLENIFIDENNTEYSDKDGVLFDKAGESLMFYPLGRKGEYVMPEGTMFVKAKAFYAHPNLTEITIAGTVTSIGANAFQSCPALEKVSFADGTADLAIGTSPTAIQYIFAGCKALKEVTLPARTTMVSGRLFADCTSLEKVVFAEGFKYTQTSNYMFYGCGALKTVEFPASFKLISTNAFYNCKALESVEIPAEVTNIYASAFYGTGLKEVTFAEGSKLDRIEMSAFNYSKELKTVELPESVTYIGNNSFQNTAIEEMIVPANVIEIGNYAFSGCSHLTKIELPDGIKKIGMYFVKNCISLTSAVIPESVTSLGTGTFAGCTNLVEAKLPSSLKTLAGTFNGCTSLVEFVVTSNITEIGSSAFQNCTNLVKVTLPATIEKIGINAFNGCASLTTLDLPANVTSIGTSALRSTGLINVTIPANVSLISNYLFAGCTDLVKVKVHGAIIEIGEYAFDGCTALTEFPVPFNVEEIGKYAYRGICLPDELLLPITLTEIGDGAFANCSGIETIELPQDLEELGSNPFVGCSKLVGFDLIDLNEAYTVVNGIIYTADMLTLVACPTGIKGEVVVADGVEEISAYAFNNCYDVTSVVLPDTVLTIGDYAFTNTGFETINLPNKLQEIGDYAFTGSSLTEILIPASVGMETTYSSVGGIGECAFASCAKLAKVEFEKGGILLLRINKYAFANCTSLEAIELPNRLVNYMTYTAKLAVSTGAFYGCTSLDDVTFEEGGLNKLTIGESAFAYCTALTEINFPTYLEDDSYSAYGSPTVYSAIHTRAFEGCTNLTTVTIDEKNQNAVQVGKYAFMNCTKLANVPFERFNKIVDGAFYNCTSITEVKLADTATLGYASPFAYCTNLTKITLNASIPNYAFQGCKNLAEVVLGENVKTIATSAFDGCESLTTITIPASVYSVYDKAFENCTALEAFKVAGGDDYAVVDGVLYNYELTELIAYPAGKAGDTFVVPETVDAIAKGAFSGSKLATITIGTNVVTIEDGAFSNCEALVNMPTAENAENYKVVDGVLYNGDMTTLIGYPAGKTDANFVVPNTVTTIGDYAFYGNPYLKTIDLGENLKSIKDFAFRYCTALTEAIIPAGVTAIGDYAFANCSELTTMELSEELVTLDEFVLYGCNKLVNLTVSKFNDNFKMQDGMLVKTIASNGNQYIFFCLPTVTGELVLDGHTMWIQKGAFANRTGITKLVIPAYTNNVYELAFDGWTAEQTIEIGRFCPPAYGYYDGWRANCLAKFIWNG